ncbi:MAG: ABC transporter permease [Chloroflexi bacterium]|nr:ABC transporter permease [Chloroflexota bacterium]
MSNRRSLWITLASLLVYVFLYAPIVVLVVFAFNSSKTNVIFEGVVNKGPCGPFYWFCVLFKNGEVLSAARNTMTIAIVSTVASTIIGTMAALALQRYAFPAKTFSEVSLYIPIVIPEIVMGIGILVLFSALFRWLNSAFGLQGDDRLALGLGTVIVSHIAFSIPFVALVVRARLHGFDKAIEEAAMDLGADEWVTFWRVTLPIIAPGVLSGGLLAFTLSLDDFVITFFTNGPGSTTLPIYVYGLLRRIITPEVNALSTVWIFTVLAALAISQRVQREA